MDAVQTTEMVEDKELELNERLTRMDEDFERWNLTEPAYPSLGGISFPGVSQTKALVGGHENDIRVVANTLRTFADEVHSKLASAEMTIAVRMAENEGEDKREDMGKLERLLMFAFEKADERLIALLLPPFRDQTIWCASIRGWVAGRFPVYKDGDNVTFGLFAYDPRWVTFSVGKNGLLWANHKTFRSAADLENEYNFTAKEELDNPVYDFWKLVKPGKVVNDVICDKVIRHSETLKMNSLPILIMPVATRPPVIGSDRSDIRGYGDSIFASVRGVNAVRNEFASIVATHANLLAKQPMINYKDDQGIEIKSTVYFAEGVINLPRGHNELVAAPMKEISPSVIQILNWLEDMVETATLPKTRVGSPPQSGTLQNLIQEARNIVFNPQLRLLGTYYAGICRLIEEQLINNKIRVDVSTIQENKYFETKVTPVDLKEPHVIKVEFTTGSPWTQMDKAQQAQMLRDLGLPEGWIWENILKIQDPKGLADLAAIELFEHSPKGAMKRAVEALIETRGDVEGAQSLIRDLDRLETQENMAVEAPVEEAP